MTSNACHRQLARALVALILACAAWAALAPPAHAGPPPPDPKTGVLSTCVAPGTPGAVTASCDPLCADSGKLDDRARENCRTGGAIARSYPLSSYGLAVNTVVTIGDKLDPTAWIATTNQSLGAALWMMLLYLFDAVLSLLTWAFSLDLLGRPEVMQQVRDGMMTFHDVILGSAWTTAALVFAALWGTWFGIVRGKTIETLGGLCATVALMVAALAMIQRPDVTILPFSSLANTASLEVLSGISRGTLDHPEQSLAFAQRGIFDSFVVRRWCTLQFGDVDYCLNQRKDGATGDVRPRRAGELSVADAWLRAGPGSSLSEQLYEKTLGKTDVGPPKHPDYKCIPQTAAMAGTAIPHVSDGHWAGDDHLDQHLDAHIAQSSWVDNEQQKVVIEEAMRQTARTREQLTLGDLLTACRALTSDTSLGRATLDVVWADPDKVWLQGGTGTLERLALIALSAIALVGAGLLFGFLGIRLLLARIYTLMYLMLLPVMFLAAACGRAGRLAAVACLQGMLRETVINFIYALFLGAVILEDNVITSLKLGAAGQLLQAVFVWGIFLQRDKWLGFLSLDQRPAEGGGLGLGSDGRRSSSPLGLSNLYYGYQMARAATGVLTGPARARINTNRRAEPAKSPALREGDEQRPTAEGDVTVSHREADISVRRDQSEAAGRPDEAGVKDRLGELHEEKARLDEQRADIVRRRDEAKDRATKATRTLADLDRAVADQRSPADRKAELMAMRPKLLHHQQQREAEAAVAGAELATHDVKLEQNAARIAALSGPNGRPRTPQDRREPPMTVVARRIRETEGPPPKRRRNVR